MDLRCPGQPRSQALSNGESDWEQGCAHDIIVIRLSIERCESKDQQSLLKAWQLPSSFCSSLTWVTLCTVWIQWQLINLKFQFRHHRQTRISLRRREGTLIIFWVGIWAATRSCFICSITHNYICGLDTKLQTSIFFSLINVPKKVVNIIASDLS